MRAAPTPDSSTCVLSGERLRPRHPTVTSTSSTSATRTTPPGPPPPGSSSRPGSTTRDGEKAIIFYDAAYEAFIQDPPLPRSIFEIEGAHDCATRVQQLLQERRLHGVRCASVVIPRPEGIRISADGKEQAIHPLWSRRHSTKFNGASYPVQKGPPPSSQRRQSPGRRFSSRGYMGNARLLREACTAAGLPVYGGVNAPYVWVGCPAGLTSWDMFDKMLNEANVVITPGSGFGAAGEGYFRISAFN